MRLIASTRTLEIPSDVTIEVKARKVRVKGPRGTARRGAMKERRRGLPLSKRRRPDRRCRAKEMTRDQRSAVSLSVAAFLSSAFTELRFETISAARGDGDSQLCRADAGLESPDQNDKKVERSSSSGGGPSSKGKRKISPLFSLQQTKHSKTNRHADA